MRGETGFGRRVWLDGWFPPAKISLPGGRAGGFAQRLRFCSLYLS